MNRDSDHEPVLCDDSSTALPFICISINSHGIKQIKRIKNPQEGCNTPLYEQVYIVEHIDQLASVKACFEVCLLCHRASI